MSISDIIQLIGILFSTITGIIAIVISILTLRQNSKMIEDSTRPYIGIYGARSYINSPNYYIVFKNFGQSSAVINSFTCDFDLSKCVESNCPEKPFQNICNSTIVPGQSFHALIDFNKTTKQTKTLTFHVSYSSGSHDYEEDICLNVIENLGNLTSHNVINGKELQIISETLQDMYIHSL